MKLLPKILKEIPGKYKSFLNFNVNEQNYGEKLTLRINIKENKIKNYNDM